MSRAEFRSAEHRLRSERATTLCLAIADCPPEVAAPILWAVLDDFHQQGLPESPLMNLMSTATAWAECAREVELKAYAVAATRRMAPATREAFLIYMRGRDGQ
jgi:hypothetical protein